MNVKDLANLDIKDLKNIDYTALLNVLKRRPDIIIESTCILMTLILCFYFYGTQKKELKELSIELQETREKSSFFDEMTAARDALGSLKDVLPEILSESEIMEILTRTARKYHIDIDSFSPAKIDEQPSHSALSITLNMKASSYADLWKFVYKLENEHKTIRIDTCSISTKAAPKNLNRRRIRLQKSVQEDEDSDKLKLTLTLTAINFKQ